MAGLKNSIILGAPSAKKKISLGEIKCAQISSLGGYSAIFECIVAAYYVEIINVVVKRKQVRFCAINLN